MRKIKMTITRMRNMSRPAGILLKMCMILSILCAGTALLLLVYAGDFTVSTYRIYSIAEKFCEMPQAILLIGALGSVCVEEAVIKKG